MQGVAFAVSHGIRQVGFQWPFELIELCQRCFQRFEARDRTQPLFEHFLIRRGSVNWICTDIHDVCESLCLQQPGQ